MTFKKILASAILAISALVMTALTITAFSTTTFAQQNNADYENGKVFRQDFNKVLGKDVCAKQAVIASERAANKAVQGTIACKMDWVRPYVGQQRVYDVAVYCFDRATIIYRAFTARILSYPTPGCKVVRLPVLSSRP